MTATEPGPHLLVADGDPEQARRLRVHLTRLGFIVLEASSAEQALSIACTRVPDAILSDVWLPDDDGFHFCWTIRRHPALAAVPLVLHATAAPVGLGADLARRAGANALVTRTPDFGAIGPALREAMRNGAPAPAEELPERARLDFARAVIRELERRVVANAELEHRCTTQSARLSLLGGVADALARGASTNAVLPALTAALRGTNVANAALFLRDGDGRLILHGVVGSSPAREAALRALASQQLRVERVVTENPLTRVDAGVFPAMESVGLTALVLVPLRSVHGDLGALLLAAERVQDLGDDAISLARHVAQAVELERAFRTIAASEQRYRSALESARDAIAILSVDGVVREVNERVTELLGVPKSRIVGRPLLEFTAPGARDASFITAASTTAHGRALPAELRRPDGSTIFVEFSSAAVSVGGEELIVAVGRDVTDEIRTQARLLIADGTTSVGLLAAGVAHEINNPLSAVVANLDLATRDVAALIQSLGKSKQLQELEAELRDSKDAAARVRAIVRDLKVFSRAEQDPREPVDVHRVLDSAARMAWNEIRHRAQLIKEYGDVPKVLANEARLGQALLNLFVSAAQTIPEGHPNANAISIRTCAASDERTVIVLVEDTGRGVPPELQEQLFTPFFTASPRAVGASLGLAICHRLITDLGGAISVESRAGKGTLFRVVLPASDVATEARSSTYPPAPIGRKGRILVVDDEALVGGAVRRALVPDHDVLHVSSAEEALERIDAGERFDLILCDLMMPVMTGMELHAKLLERAPDQAERMAFLTGGAFSPTAREFLENTRNPRLEKPFDLATLEAFVNARLR